MRKKVFDYIIFPTPSVAELAADQSQSLWLCPGCAMHLEKQL